MEEEEGGAMREGGGERSDKVTSVLPTFLSLLVPSTETSCLVVGSMIAILFLSRVRVEVLWGAAAAWRRGHELAGNYFPCIDIYLCLKNNKK